MPEMIVTVRWPDGTTQRCYSPSLVMHDYFTEGRDYPVAAFTGLARTALGVASERVRAKYGVPCSAAAASLADIEAVAASYTAGSVTVLSMTGHELLGT